MANLLEKLVFYLSSMKRNGMYLSGYNEKEKREIFNQDAAFMLTDVMQGVINESYGTCKNMDLNGQIAAVKTGTTDHVRDSWLCGYTTHYTTSVWVGNDDNTPLSSSNYAKNIWKDFVNKIHADKANRRFHWYQLLFNIEKLVKMEILRMKLQKTWICLLSSYES